MPSWAKRSATVCVCAPLAIKLLQTELGSFAFIQALACIAAWEYAHNLRGPILSRAAAARMARIFSCVSTLMLPSMRSALPIGADSIVADTGCGATCKSTRAAAGASTDQSLATKEKAFLTQGLPA